ncbi:MAG: adenylosuccinate synthase [Verrucomicrobiota bacterium]
MMNTVLVGVQWGDEGKGKIIDFLTEVNDVVVRSQGGNNAGHTVEVGEKQYILHLIPSGILTKAKKCLIGNGTVVDPLSLVQEIEGLHERGIKTRGRLYLSDRAHLVMPYHRIADAGNEASKRVKIGTTKRGIGPTYQDKINRVGFRVHDLLDKDSFAGKLKARIREVNKIHKQNGWEALSAAKVNKSFMDAAELLRPYICDGIHLLHDFMDAKKRILFEGAQGTFLDIDYGTYPFVTSSNTTSGGSCTGAGIPPTSINTVYGVVKAYTTRVGEGPFPTEEDSLGDLLHGMGREFGATTGRARRCGWFDGVLARFSGRINGVDKLAITNIDGLDGLEEIKVCEYYKLGRKKLDYPPSNPEALKACKPIYTTFKGWKTSTSKAREWKDLPLKARQYLKVLSELSGSKIDIVSVGPKRQETFYV